MKRRDVPLKEDIYLNDYREFCQIITDGDFDNRSLAIDLEMALGIPSNHINSKTSMWGGDEYHIRYNDILVIMTWSDSLMKFTSSNRYGIYQGDTIVSFRTV